MTIMSANNLGKDKAGNKNKKGTRFSYDQLIELTKYDVLKNLSIIESYEICREKNPHSSLETIGSINAEMASHLTSGKLRPIARERAQLSIAALSAGL
jgi:hypothetical protein